MATQSRPQVYTFKVLAADGFPRFIYARFGVSTCQEAKLLFERTHAAYMPAHSRLVRVQKGQVG